MLYKYDMINILPIIYIHWRSLLMDRHPPESYRGLLFVYSFIHHLSTFKLTSLTITTKINITKIIIIKITIIKNTIIKITIIKITITIHTNQNYYYHSYKSKLLLSFIQIKITIIIHTNQN